MTNYKQYRADFAKAAWIAHMNDCDHEVAAERAILWADTFIAELERTDAVLNAQLPLPWEMDAGDPKPETQEQPELPKLNTGWKWAEEGHTITRWDVWVEKGGRVMEDGGVCEGDILCIQPTGGLATPDWHNPENIAGPGERYRFLVKGEKRLDSTHFKWVQDDGWKETPNGQENPVVGSGGFTATYRTPATRPLPPVLAE